eukprot:g8249.t1
MPPKKAKKIRVKPKLQVGSKITLTYMEGGKKVKYNATITSLDSKNKAMLTFDNGIVQVMTLQGKDNPGVKWAFTKHVVQRKKYGKPKGIYKKEKKLPAKPIVSERLQQMAISRQVDDDTTNRVNGIIAHVRTNINDPMGMKIWLSECRERDIRKIAEILHLVVQRFDSLPKIIAAIVNRIQLEHMAMMGMIDLGGNRELKL